MLLDSLFNGVAIGSVLLVAALGLAIVFGLMGVINLAHGELMMLGAYTTYVTQLIFKLPLLKPYYNSYVIVSIFFAFIVLFTLFVTVYKKAKLSILEICLLLVNIFKYMKYIRVLYIYIYIIYIYIYI